jgi:hypothetical protein
MALARTGVPDRALDELEIRCNLCDPDDYLIGLGGGHRDAQEMGTAMTPDIH